MTIDYFALFIKLALGFAAFVLQIGLAGRGNLAPSNAIDQLQNFVLGGSLAVSFTIPPLRRCNSSSFCCFGASSSSVLASWQITTALLVRY
ncbi:hypothetical protein [Schleiferilactobacillus harbinensis]|uniref:hypothetical protein n=1 Tax=Schleiferilactobacillus harbinensis TaxID=304207 RepID=UPI0035CEEEE9